MSRRKPLAEVRAMVRIGGYGHGCDGCIAEICEIVAAELAKRKKPAGALEPVAAAE